MPCRTLPCALSSFPEIILIFAALASLSVVGICLVILWKQKDVSWTLFAVFVVSLLVLAFPMASSLELQFGPTGASAKMQQGPAVSAKNPESQNALNIAEVTGKFAELMRRIELLEKAGSAPAGDARLNELKKNGAHSVIIYYTDAADPSANELLEKLIEAGFKAARVNTDLTEVGRLENPGSIRIRYNKGQEGAAATVQSLIGTGKASTDRRAVSRQIPGDVQVLMY